jgi:putative tryptophan/tyrosine transport system substrate-binding protein
MRRREFIVGLGAAAAWPHFARAQEKKPVIGYLHVGSRAENAKRLAAFWKGLGETGFVEGQNVDIEYRWAEGHADRLESLAADLVRRDVAVIATPAVTAAAVAAKKATSVIPIVFASGADPVAVGLVASLSHPGGNATGVTTMNASLAAKRFQIARELAPNATRLFTLVNPTSPLTGPFLEGLQRAATNSGARVDVLSASTPEEIDAVFASLPDAAGSVFISSPDSQFFNWRAQIVSLVMRRRLTSLFDVPDYVEAGGLASYGNDFLDLIRVSGIYVGRILKGEKPADLPVVQAEKFVFAVNLKSAAALGVEIPPTLLAAADEIIE